MADVVNVTPKRKRGADVSFPPLVFSFDLAATGLAEDGGDSPRSATVVHRFRGLALGGGGGSGGGAAGAADEMGVESDASTRKRQKSDEDAHTAAQVQPQPKPQLEPGPEMDPTAVVGMAGDSVLQLSVPPPSAEGLPRTIFPSLDRLSESQSRKKRAGTPPLRFKAGHPQDGLSDADNEAEVVDPLRASLTWHEDEITIYDPNDKDDDGTGINGVGFKPTPALAHARVMKRRQQMADYRKREENEARNKRSQRRRGEMTASARRDPKSSPSRRVRFMDAESRNLTMTA
ncbi:hypothetical protein Trco_005181 [Trichoderma cornu-damae]|uniref:Uncharacterized protein n=1 Tax=Trichoderma cornu-damae TaxID=654480 RepID=A0A9P8QNQ9_9HYPO|nr:hypothetical protein Trco_005181 [Trichoderma cornu-damae]